jgi:hypothetical protein
MSCSVLYYVSEDGSTRWRCPKVFGTKESHSFNQTRCWRHNCPGAKPINQEALCQRKNCTNLRRLARDAKYCSDNCRKNAYKDRVKLNSLPT